MRMNAQEAIQSAMSSLTIAMVGLLVLAQGCSQHVDTVVIKPETCPLPQSLSVEDQSKIERFGAEISGLMSSLTGAKLQADVQNKLQREYPDAADVNQIYALSYSACVACRLDPNDVKDCAQRFDEIIETNSKNTASVPGPANNYRSQLLVPLRGTK